MPFFARHETFHPRFGWLKKGFDAAVQDSGIFLREDAPVRLGVGKNMVRSIRYWCNAFKVLESASSNQKARQNAPTNFGSKLLSDDGWDPFLEDPASLWLLHWSLLSPPYYATAWNFTFNYFLRSEFSVDDLFIGLCDYRDSLSNATADSSLRKDITCILRMYAEQDAKTGTPVPGKKQSFPSWLPNEDSLDCPFTELGILATARQFEGRRRFEGRTSSPSTASTSSPSTASGDSKHYTFRVGAKTNLPAQIIVSACLEFASRVGKNTHTISLSRLTFDTGSPGMAFKLNESAVCDAIEQVSAGGDFIRLSDTAGLIQLSYTQDPAVLAKAILDRYYKDRRGAAQSDEKAVV